MTMKIYTMEKLWRKYYNYYTKVENLIFGKWEEEAKKYDFTKNKLVKEASHFIQIIWKETKQIGIGFSSDEDNKKYCIVVLFDPPGNTLGEFANNVTHINE